MLQKLALGLGLEIWNSGRSGESGDGKESLYIGEMTPVFVIDHLRFRDASHLTIREEEELLWPGSEADAFPFASRRGGKSFATHKSP